MMPMEEEAFYRCRVAAIQAQLATENLHGILLLDTYNVMYASGFIHTESERPIGFFVPAVGMASWRAFGARAIIGICCWACGRPECTACNIDDTMIVGDNEALVPSRFLAEHPPEQGILNI